MPRVDGRLRLYADAEPAVTIVHEELMLVLFRERYGGIGEGCHLGLAPGQMFMAHLGF